MSGENRKPGSGAVPPEDTVATDGDGGGPRVGQNTSGRVKFDDRGNAIWEWAGNPGVSPTEGSSARLKKLDNPTLSIADDAPSLLDSAKLTIKDAVKGYSPYDSGLLVKDRAGGPKKDLRRLGEWMKLRRQASSKKPDEE